MTSKIESAALSVAQKVEGHDSKQEKKDEKLEELNDTASEQSTSTSTSTSKGTDAANDAAFDAGERKSSVDDEGGKDGDGEKKGPKGGFDDTPIPKAPPGYTLKFTFHRATNLPMADINTLSSDPFIVAQLYTDLQPRHKEDPPLRLRTPTMRRNTEPVWNTEWIVANVPASGFKLKCRIYDEDPADHDDRLGNATIVVQGINDEWPGIQDQGYKIKKRMGSKRAYLMRGLAVALRKTKHMYGSLFLSVQVLGKTEGEGGRCYTVGPMWYTKHYSPMLGRIANRKEPDDDSPGAEHKAQRYNFQANQFQMQGPVPAELYHRFVEFKPFVKRMFTSSGVEGFLLSKALHHQHARVYNYDRTTEYGVFKDAPSEESTIKFLELVHWAQGGRIFTYVLTLDALFRFTETGKEFGIDFLSKHTMHSDVNIYIAYSGEFFVRRLKHKDRPTPEEHLHSPDSQKDGRQSSEHSANLPRQSAEDQTIEHPPHHLRGEPPRDPRYYQLVIDNDSGTYRPNAKLLPILKEYLQRQLPGMHIVTLDCQQDAELQQKMKAEQRETKKAEGDTILYRQASDSSSISSSDLSDLDEMEGAEARERGSWKAVGKDAKLKGKAMGRRWKGFVHGRGGEDPASNADGEDQAKGAHEGIQKLTVADQVEQPTVAT
ncbi:uncharacterized protein PV09_06821 [Verruconis gallopava]|uniref:C2 domain-containing protein n=1 Tax=Verruconis gallopava TaxID=253628 RepID=A0A0D2AR13_9PEZI|nr:uncharacterized protein PV09_06821 [Verruconis gallopava]KIW01634.1 hypothetical protein PV09_06821 [Verruconis gallopava]